MFEQTSAPASRNGVADWALRAGIAIAFAIFGAEKFDAHSMWPGFFQQIGLGQWFRYITGVVEILGGALLLIPGAVTAGLALLAATMAAAALIHIFVIHQPGNCVIPVVFCAALCGFWLNRRGR